MGCGASSPSPKDDQQEKHDKRESKRGSLHANEALGVVPVSSDAPAVPQDTAGGVVAEVGTKEGAPAADMNGAQKPGGDPAAAAPHDDADAAVLGSSARNKWIPKKGTLRRLCAVNRVPCPYEEGEGEEKRVLWELMKGQVVLAHPPPPSAAQLLEPHCHFGTPVTIGCDFGSVTIRLTNEEAEEVPERAKPASFDVAEALDLSALPPTKLLRSRARRARVCGVDVRHVTGHGRAVKTVGLSGDGRLLVSGDGIDVRQALRCIDPKTGRHVGTLNGYRGSSGEAPCDLCFSTNGQQLATCDQSDTLLLWDMTTFRCKKTLQFEGEDGSELFLVGVRLSPDMKLVAAAAEQSDEEGVSRGRVVLWDLDAKKQRLMFNEHQASVLCLSFAPCSTLVSSGGRDGQLFVWRSSDGSIVHKLSGHTSGVRSCQFSYDGSLLLTNDARVLCLWDVQNGQARSSRHIDGETQHATLPEAAQPAEGAQASKTRFMVSIFVAGGWILAAASDKQVRLLDATSGEEVYRFATKAPVTCVSAARHSVALGDVWGNVYLADLLLKGQGEPGADIRPAR